jgi:carbon storage regulator CsrA
VTGVGGNVLSDGFEKVYGNRRTGNMLVLSRKRNQKIVVLDHETNEEILSVQVINVVGDQVRLGFETPGPRLPIYRQEVYARINDEAANVLLR